MISSPPSHSLIVKLLDGWRVAGLGLAALALGCGDAGTSAADTTDAGDVADAADARDDVDATDATETGDPWAGVAACVELVEWYDRGAGAITGGQVQVRVSDGVAPTRLVLVHAEGACRAWAQSDVACATCEPGVTTCDGDGVCQREPQPISAGVVRIDAALAFTATPTTPIPYYVIAPDVPPTGLFAPGEALRVEAAGAGAMAAFEADLEGVSDLVLAVDDGHVALVDGAAYTLTWTPDGSDATVEVVLQLGWHGTPPIARIVCAAPDAAGALTIPAAIIARFPYFTGGLFQVPSWAERLSRRVLPGAFGPIEVRAASRTGLFVTHTDE